MQWEPLAACTGTPSHLFFEEANEAEAKEICAGCPVADHCLTSQLGWEEEEGYFQMFGSSGERGARLMFGVFGGLSGQERWDFVFGALDGRLGEVLRLENPAEIIGRALTIWEEQT